MFSTRIKLIVKLTELFHILNDGSWVPLKYAIIAGNLEQGASPPFDIDSVVGRYVSHNMVIRNLCSDNLYIHWRIPYIEWHSREGVAASAAELVAHNTSGLVVEASDVASYQSKYQLATYHGSTLSAEVIDGIKLLEFELSPPPSELRSGLLRKIETELLAIHITVNFLRLSDKTGIPDLRFFTWRSFPDIYFAKTAVGAQEAGVQIIQLSDEGYPFIGIDTDPVTKFGVLNWHTLQGKVSAVRIRNLEDTNIRLVIPALHVSMQNIKYELDGLQPPDNIWTVRRYSTELGYNEDHGWWNVMRHNEPYKFYSDNNHQNYYDALPEAATSLSPIMYYSKVRPSQLAARIPQFSPEERYGAFPLKRWRPKLL